MGLFWPCADVDLLTPGVLILTCFAGSREGICPPCGEDNHGDNDPDNDTDHSPGVHTREVGPGAVHAEAGDRHHGPDPAQLGGEHRAPGVPVTSVPGAVTRTHLARCDDDIYNDNNDNVPTLVSPMVTRLMAEYASLHLAWVTMGTLACLSLLEEPPPVAVEPQPR